MRLDGYKKAEKEGSDGHDRRTGRVKAIKEPELPVELIRKMVDEKLELQNQNLVQLEQRLTHAMEAYMRPPMSADAGRFNEQCLYRRQENQNRGRRTFGRFPPRNSRFNNSRTNQGCFNCGQFGHFARVCPSKQPELPLVNDSSNEQEPSAFRHVSGSNNAYLSLKVNGKSTFALLDTGCEMTLAPSSLVRKKDIRVSNQTLRAANGTAIRVLGEAKINCEIDGYSFGVSCLITEQISELILGLVWLENQNAVWNFGERWVKIQNHTFPTCTRVRQGNCRRIIVERDVKVPPMSEMDINTYAVVSHLRSQDSQWATQPQVLNSGLVIAGTLLPERILDLPVRVMNPTHQDIW